MDANADSCSHCGKPGAGYKRCEVCKTASYCGVECHKAAWQRHVKECGPGPDVQILRASRATADKPEIPSDASTKQAVLSLLSLGQDSGEAPQKRSRVGEEAGPAHQRPPSGGGMVGIKRGAERSSAEGGSGGNVKKGKVDDDFSDSESDEKADIPKGPKPRPWSCNTCGKAFARSNSLSAHVRTHTGERPYPCATCGKAFTTSNNLTAHMRTHTSDRPYLCTACTKTFARPDHLTEHMRSHSGDRPYDCTVCRKNFARSCDLSRHARTHSGQKPNVCITCGKSFARANDLSRHCENVHKLLLPQ